MSSLISILGLIFGALIINQVLIYTGTMDYLYIYLDNMYERMFFILDNFYKPLLGSIPTALLLWLLIVPVLGLIIKILKG